MGVGEWEKPRPPFAIDHSPFAFSNFSQRSLIFFSTSFSNPCSRMYFSQFWSIAAFMKKPSSMGAGPLMVMDTEVFGSLRSKPL
ncbi:MAG: hypothetical protein GFGODING_02880 [Flavobacteriales bacterium]|nr:hypothetical protein [Flavobacteriales bacterium]